MGNDGEVKKKIKFRRWIKKNKKSVIIAGVLVFPLLVGGIYAIPLPQIIPIDAPDMLAYYGVALGIVSSFCIYQDEKKRKIKERKRKNRPRFIVKVEKSKDFERVFLVHIIKNTKANLSYLYLHDEMLSEVVEKKHKIRVLYSKSVKEIKEYKENYDFCVDYDVLDSDGYPKSIELLCDDEDSNAWLITYYKVNDGVHIYYYPEVEEI